MTKRVRGLKDFWFRPQSVPAHYFLLRGYTRGIRVDRKVFFGSPLTFLKVASNLPRRVQGREGKGRLVSHTCARSSSPLPASRCKLSEIVQPETRECFDQARSAPGVDPGIVVAAECDSRWAGCDRFVAVRQRGQRCGPGGASRVHIGAISVHAPAASADAAVGPSLSSRWRFGRSGLVARTTIAT